MEDEANSAGRTERRLRSIMSANPDLMIVVDEEGRYLEIFAPDPALLFSPAEELLGKTIHEALPTEAAAEIQGVIDRTLATGELQEWEYTLLIGGELHSFQARVVPFESSDARAVLWVARDVSENKKAEEERRRFEAQALRSQKLESLGVLAGGIAHDFNNLLVGVLGNVDLIRRHLPDASPGLEHLRDVERAALHAADLCRQMLDYSGRRQLVIEALDLSEAVDDIANLLKTGVSKGVELTFELGRDLPSVRGDPTQIRQVALNLITNASESIGSRGNGEGKVAIRTTALDCSEEDFSTSLPGLRPKSGRFVAIEVSDDGCGMTQETLDRIFDPFFTTKFAGRGLGMASVLGIVRGHDGAIQVDTKPDRGTTFRILFPISSEQVGAPSTSGLPADLQRGRARADGLILIADDDATVRKVSRMILEEEGYSVLLAEDGVDAVEQFRLRHAQLDCVILDLTMPRMGGEEAFLEMWSIDPTVPVILTSGYTVNELHGRFDDHAPHRFLQKPYMANTLLEEIRLALGR